MITVGLGTWCRRRRGWGESEEFVQRGLWGRSGFCLLEMRRGVSQTSKWLCSSSLSGQAKKSGGESSFSFLPVTSARAEKSQSALPWEAGRGLAWDAGHG